MTSPDPNRVLIMYTQRRAVPFNNIVNVDPDRTYTVGW